MADQQQSTHQRDRGAYSLPYDNPYSELGPIDHPHDQEPPKYDPSTSSSFFDAIRTNEEERDEQEGRTAQDDADTQNALKQLFNPVTDTDEDGLQLDPTLASEIEAQHQHQHHGQPLEVGSAESPVESGTGAPAKRKATSRADMLARGGACDFCKRRKLKCSAELPSCAACRRSGRDCVYSQKKQRSKVKLLEDRLVELERRLGQQPHNPTGVPPAPDLIESAAHHQEHQQHSDGAEDGGAAAAFADSVDTTILETPSYHYGVPHINSTFHLPDYEVENMVQEAEVALPKDHEPDLMTLADAAAGRDSAWEGMTPETIAKEIVHAVDGGKGVGEKIISHLIMVYRNAGYIFFLSDLIPAEALTARLVGRTKPRPHPSLLLSVISWLLPYSSSPSLSAPDRFAQIYALLQPHARSQSMEAMVNPDGRLLDVIIADAARAMNCYRQARFLEGWGEGARAAALVWAAGLGKLGGVGARFVDSAIEGREEVIKKEKRLRSLVHKGQVIEPPKDATELGYQINVLRLEYLLSRSVCCDRMGLAVKYASQRDISSSLVGRADLPDFVMEEITTPLPKDSYTDPAALVDNYTLNDFLDPTVSAAPAAESDFAAFIKCQTLLLRAYRLFDLSPKVTGPDAVGRLLSIAKRQEGSMRQVPANPTSAAEVAVQHSLLTQAWMALYTAMAYLYAKKEMDERTRANDDLPQTQCVDALTKVVDHLNMSYEGGDMELEGMTICAQTVWFAAASLAYRIHRRLSASTRSERYKAALTETRRVGDELTRACHITASVLPCVYSFAVGPVDGLQGKKEKYGATTAQLLENIAMGQDVKMGEWERPDNLA